VQYYTSYFRRHIVLGAGDYLQVPRPGELGLWDECPREILRCAQDDKKRGMTAMCHPERSEGSVAHVWVITNIVLESLPFAGLHYQR
jgi:hypothetical protein